MTVNWPEGSVTVIYLPWADLGRLPPAASTHSPETFAPHTRKLTYQLSPTGSTSGHQCMGKHHDYIASNLIITSSLLFILWWYIIKTVTSKEMKCRSELQAYAEAGHKSAGRAKRSSLLIAYILPAVRGVQQLCSGLADWEQTHKTVCTDHPRGALMTCLVWSVRNGDMQRVAYRGQAEMLHMCVSGDKGCKGKCCIL